MLVRRNALMAVLCVTVIQSLLFAQNEKNDRFKQLDRNQDDKLVRDELPEGVRTQFDEIDANKDNALTREEVTAYFRAQNQKGATARKEAPRLEPTHADVRYGAHERNIIDLYLAKSDQPTPVVLYIHGGGFQGGDKRTLNPIEGKSYLDAGYSIAAINYRLTQTAPAPAAYLDCARAIQFLRHNAKQWNLDPTLFASTGGSAGAGTSLWIAFHDDLADPKSDDPIARQSTRLICTVVSNGQSSYDPRFAEKIGIPRPNFERHPFFLPFYAITKDEIDTPKAYERYEQAAPITYLTKDDPPAMLNYSFANEEVTKDSSLNLVVHHPKFGIALKEEMDQLGIECVVQYQDPEARRIVRHGAAGEPISPVQFVRKHFEEARRKKSG